jgi:hypothetical protein
MAEREGFEPSTQFNPCNNLAGCRFRPLSHLSGFCDRTIADCGLADSLPLSPYGTAPQRGAYSGSKRIDRI